MVTAAEGVLLKKIQFEHDPLNLCGFMENEGTGSEFNCNYVNFHI